MQSFCRIFALSHCKNPLYMHERNKVTKDVKAGCIVLCENMVHQAGKV